MKKFRKVAILTIIAPMMASLVSCDDAFSPAVENHKDMSQLEDMPQWAVGLLGHAYISNPLGQNADQWWKWTEVATDDAVINDVNNQYRRMALGSWRADNNPMENWRYLRGSWQYINQMIELAPNVEWANEPVAAELYKERFLGEAYGMRAFYMYHLLMAHAGWVGDQLLGIPILTESETVASDFNKPRNTFAECLAQLNSDVEQAIKYLPEDYGDISDNSAVPAKYVAVGATATTYTRVFGDHAKNRMSARVARAVRAQAALLAASPAYNQGSGVTWDDAANRMAEVLKGLGSNPIAQMDPVGHHWYTEYEAMKKWEAGYNSPEILWRSNKGGDDATSDGGCIEKQNFPPSLYGNGRVNPSQNFVDAFPMADGTPISESSSYDPQNPYENRDPRLALYVVTNGSKMSGQTIITAEDGTNDDALNHFDGRSTRTGYYMRKLLVEDVICNPSNATGQVHVKPWMRYTEFFLGYAEAANEAWGPTGTGSNGFSAYDVIKAIRQRAGAGKGLDGSDPYLEKCKGDKSLMRELIRNERRIELCFEGFRFWDLRRWKLDVTKLNEKAKGMRISNNHYTVFDVEERKYQDYMSYGPIPFSELLKFSELKQNNGWEDRKN